MRESKIEKEFKKEAEKNGWWCLKMRVVNHAGFPDRVLLRHPGVVRFVEVKAPGKTLRPLQKFVFKKLKNLGFDCYVLDCIESIDEIIA
jgi:hypothetical protein